MKREIFEKKFNFSYFFDKNIKRTEQKNIKNIPTEKVINNQLKISNIFLKIFNNPKDNNKKESPKPH